MKLLACFVFAVTFIGSSRAIIRRVCEGGTLHLSCDTGEVISLNNANYGRTAGVAVCPHPSINTASCFASSSYNIVFNACEGEQSCSVSATNGVFGDPCRGTYKYLEVDYTCYRKASCETRRVCEGGSIYLHCPEDRPAIHICDTLYGRNVPGSVLCPHPSTSNTNCAAWSAKYWVQRRCQGKAGCHVSASNSVFGDPCVGTYKYLEVNYTCARRGRSCEHHHLTLTCPAGQTILVLDAFYGRMEGPNVCPHSQTSNRNCRATSGMFLVENACNGHNSCTLFASNQVFGDPCPRTYKYLEVLYECA